MTTIPMLGPGSKLTIHQAKPKAVPMHTFQDIALFSEACTQYGEIAEWALWVVSPLIGSEEFYSAIEMGFDPDDV